MPNRSRAETLELLKQARERFEQGQKATAKQRQRILDDLAFYAGGEHQWDAETLRNRQAQQGVAGLPPVPARPCITINKVREPIHQVLNQERQSDMGIQLVPADDWGELAPPVSEEEIELREGLVRRIQRESEAADARTWAFTRAAIAGEGYYRVLTRYVPGKPQYYDDKDVFVARIYNQSSVTLDPAHEQPDGSDCEWEFIGGDVPWDRAKREHPRLANGDRNRWANADDAAFRALGEEYPGWYTETGETKSVRIVEYFYTEWTNQTLCKLSDGRAFWEDELPADFPEDQILETREVPQKAIKWAKIDATQILEETDWEGPDMPVIKVLGEELQPFDNERRAEGMVRPARGAQEGFNAMVSKWVESVGLAPIPPFQMPEENIGPYGAWYQLANTRTLPSLPYISFDAQGRPLAKPERTNVDTPIQAIASSVQMFDEAIKSTTMVPSVQLGHSTDAQLKSGKAIDSLKEQGLLGTSHLLDNLRRSIRYEGQIENNLLFPIYGRPGRLARMLTGENEPKSVRIGGSNGQPTTGGVVGASPAGGGQFHPGPTGTPPVPSMGAQPNAGPQGPPPAPPKTYMLTKDANFNVIVKVTRNLDSRREEESSFVGTLLQANPELMAWFGDLFFKNQDGPGHDEMAERAEVMLDPKIQAMRAAKQQGSTMPPEATAQIAQMKQQLDQAHQVMQQAQNELKLKGEQHQREQETKLKLAQMAHDQAIEIQKMKDASALAVARLTSAANVLDQTHEDAEEAIALAQQQQHEAEQNALDREHELDQAQMGHEHALEQGQQSPPLDPNRPPLQAGAGA